MTKQFSKSHENIFFTGTISGISKYFDIDPVYLRMLILGLSLFSGIGILVYLFASILIPKSFKSRMNVKNILGSAFILIPVYYILNQLNLLRYIILTPVPEFFTPLFIILISVSLFVNVQGGTFLTGSRKLLLKTEQKMILGVCSSLSEFTGIGLVSLRLSFISLLFVTMGVFFIVYLFFYLTIPREQT